MLSLMASEKLDRLVRFRFFNLERFCSHSLALIVGGKLEHLGARLRIAK